MHDLVTLHNVVRILWNYIHDSFHLHIWISCLRFSNIMYHLEAFCIISSSFFAQEDILYCLLTFPCLIFPFILPCYADYNVTFIIIQFMDAFNVDKMVTKLVESKWGCGSHLMFLFDYKGHALKSQDYAVFHSIDRLLLDEYCLIFTNEA